jgi:hypothetical protein
MNFYHSNDHPLPGGSVIYLTKHEQDNGGASKLDTDKELEAIINQMLALSQTMEKRFGIRVTLSDVDDSSGEANKELVGVTEASNPPQQFGNPVSSSADYDTSNVSTYFLQSGTGAVNTFHPQSGTGGPCSFSPQSSTAPPSTSCTFVKIGNGADISRLISDWQAVDVAKPESEAAKHAFVLVFPDGSKVAVGEVAKAIETLFPGYSANVWMPRQHI